MFLADIGIELREAPELVGADKIRGIVKAAEVLRELELALDLALQSRRQRLPRDLALRRRFFAQHVMHDAGDRRGDGEAEQQDGRAPETVLHRALRGPCLGAVGWVGFGGWPRGWYGSHPQSLPLNS